MSNNWNERVNSNQYMYIVEGEYSSLKNQEQYILGNINKPYQPIRLWRYKDKFYYRPAQYDELIICNSKELATEISSRCNKYNIQIVNDLNDVLSYKKMGIRINTIYIAINSIPVIEKEVFNPYIADEIFQDDQGFLTRNCFTYTYYLEERLITNPSYNNLHSK